MKLNAYYLPYADGSNHLLVAARNQKEACEIMNVPVGYFRRFGGQKIGGMTADVALSEPFRLWKQDGRDLKVAPWVLVPGR